MGTHQRGSIGARPSVHALSLDQETFHAQKFPDFRTGRAVGLHAGAQEMVAWPIVPILVLFGALLVLTQGSAVAPFIYTIF